MRRTYAKIKPRANNFRTIYNTAWIYPKANILSALATTTYKYKYEGDFITCPTIGDIIGVYNDIYIKTTISQPTGNVGFSLGVGTLLEDMGDEIRFRLTNGNVVVIWRLVKQLTPQLPSTVIPVPGNSPNETIGYITTFCSYGSGVNGGYSVGLDDVILVRIG